MPVRWCLVLLCIFITFNFEGQDNLVLQSKFNTKIKNYENKIDIYVYWYFITCIYRL